jgi:UDP-N-acetylglucosamine 3-dehydrogenase
MTVRIGVLAPYHVHGPGFGPGVAEQDGVEFVGIADDDEDRGRRVAAEDDTEYFEDRDELLEQVDAVGVFAAIPERRRYIEAAAAHGCDVIVEKPLALTAAEARRSADACEEAGVLMGMALPLRFNEVVRQAHRVLAEGAIGELQSVVGTNRCPLPGDHEWIDVHGGRGTVAAHTCHVTDLARAITGEEVAEVYAETGRLFGDQPGEDAELLSMEMSDGTVFTHDGSRSRPDNHYQGATVDMKLVGTEGVVDLDGYERVVYEIRDTEPGAGWNTNNFGSEHGDRLDRDFVEAVRERRPMAVTGEDGVREAAIVEAAYESAERGEPVAVDWPE